MSTTDSTETQRMTLIALGIPEAVLEAVIASGGQTWDTKQLQDDFEVLGFSAPFVIVKKKDTKEKGTLTFTHSPRFYFDWRPTS